MPFEILLVCAANVCRSPTAAALLRDRLEDSAGDLPGDSLAATIRLTDAGIAARAGEGLCPRARRWLAATGSEPTVLPHASRSLGLADIARADLVIAMDRDVRATVLGRGVGQVADLRQRLFTLLEASALAAGVAAALAHSADRPLDRSPDLSSRSAGPGPEPLPAYVEERLRWLVTEMDAARGLVRVPRRRRLGSTHHLDVPDAHALGTNHRRTLPLIDDGVQELLAALRRVADAPGVRASGPTGRRIKR